MDRARSRLEIAQRRTRSALSPKPNPGLPGFGHSLLVAVSGQARSRLGEGDRPAPAGRKGIPPLPQHAMNAIDRFVMDITSAKGVARYSPAVQMGLSCRTYGSSQPLTRGTRIRKTSSLAVAAALIMPARLEAWGVGDVRQ
jgi:hypothetical protein